MRCLTVLLLAAAAFAQTPAPKDFDITSSDGTKLRSTFYAAAKPGPGVLLLHMCNTTRKSWQPAAKQLADAGINALTIDNRGFGESGGPNYDKATPEVQKQIEEHWPADFDAAWQYLSSNPNVDKARIAAGGGSCGVNNAIKLAQRHPEVKSLVLLAGGTEPDGVVFLIDHPQISLFTAAAADDQYISSAPQLMQWYSQLSPNPQNKFMSFPNGKHGTEIFGPHPELVRAIVAFYVETLNHPAPAVVSGQSTKVAEFWKVASAPGGAAHATQMFQAAHQRDPNAYVFPEALMNLLGYRALQAGQTDDAIQLFKLNTEAYPASANAQDSLSDGYLAAGKKDLALAAEEKCLALLPSDPAGAEFKAELKKHAEEKVAKLKSN
jgi:dienelactone hydrolase